MKILLFISGGTIALVAVILGLAALFFWGLVLKPKWDKARKQKRTLDRMAVKDMPTVYPYIYDEAGKPHINSIVPVPEAVRLTCQKALEILILATGAKFPDWKYGASPADYNIIFVKPEAINQVNSPGAPSIFYRTYDDPGNETSKTQTAGTVLGIDWDNFKPLSIVLPHQDDPSQNLNWQYLYYLFQTVWNEGEHYREYLNDSSGVFRQYLGSRDLHQHHPLPAEYHHLLPPNNDPQNAARGFVGKQEKLSCFGEVK